MAYPFTTQIAWSAKAHDNIMPLRAMCIDEHLMRTVEKLETFNVCVTCGHNLLFHVN